MNITVLQSIIDFILGHKYYVNIVNTRGTAKCEATSYIHRSKTEAEKHRQDIESTRSFLFLETVSFRSRKVY